MATINMQTMRYINLLDNASKVKTQKCFVYNNTIYFAVPAQLVSKAIGPNALNIKKIQESLGKRIRIIREPEGIYDIARFIGEVVYPIRFKSLEVKENVVVITSGNNQNKAALIGREKRRFYELEEVVHEIFKMDLKIL